MHFVSFYFCVVLALLILGWRGAKKHGGGAVIWGVAMLVLAWPLVLASRFWSAP